MVSEGLVPGMEHGKQAECSTQVSVGKLQQGLGDGPEQDGTEDFLVAQSNRVELMRESKDQVEVTDG